MLPALFWVEMEYGYRKEVLFLKDGVVTYSDIK